MSKHLYVFCLAILLVGTTSYAASAKTYQVTGPILEITDSTIVVQKGEEKWEIARDAAAKIKGELKVGAKVTIQYRMVATDVEVKAEKAK
jgi:hypothetical protein